MIKMIYVSGFFVISCFMQTTMAMQLTDVKRFEACLGELTAYIDRSFLQVTAIVQDPTIAGEKKKSSLLEIQTELSKKRDAVQSAQQKTRTDKTSRSTGEQQMVRNLSAGFESSKLRMAAFNKLLSSEIKKLSAK